MIKAKTLSNIAGEYGMGEKTLRRMLKEKNILYRRGLNLKPEQKRIYEELGYPKGVDKNDYKDMEIPPLL